MIAADTHPRSLGFRSRYAAQKVVYPSPVTSPDPYLDCMLDAVERHHVDLVIPVTDPAILPLSRARERFAGKCRLAVPDDDALDATTDKLKTVELAQRLDVPVPTTRLVHTADEAEREAKSLDWPVVIKPQRSQVYRDDEVIEAFRVSYADTPSRLMTIIRALEGRCGALLQQYVPGRGVGVEMLAHEGRPLAVFQHRRIREYPSTGGVSACCESVKLDTRLYEYAKRLMRALNWTGLAMVEFKLGADGPLLMEINGRVWGSLPLAVRCGMDFPVRMAQLYMDDSFSHRGGADNSYLEGVRLRNLELELKWIISVLFFRRQYPFVAAPSRWRAIWVGLSLLNPFCHYGLQSIRDPGPGLADFGKIVREFWSKKW
jgi:predicted ATP-grasp superfamily ATP-dependent carboligase